MTTPTREPDDGPALVPGELRGYRQFELRPDGLYPLVQAGSGPWDGQLERARCATGGDHAAPAGDCRCGLYAWYRPGAATVAIGPVSAVVAARGRCVLGDRGFRAAEARIEAVTLPLAMRIYPSTAARTRRMLAERYPDTRIYPTARQMLRDYPPQDVRELGIDPPGDRSRGYRAAVVAVLVTVMVCTGALAAMPGYAIAYGFAGWWPLLVLFTIAWQAGLVWLVARLLALQGPAVKGPP